MCFKSIMFDKILAADGVSVGVPSDVIDRLRILWIFGFGHHTDHKGCRHNQEKSVFASKI